MVIFLFCYFNCHSSIYIFVFILFVTLNILILSYHFTTLILDSTILISLFHFFNFIAKFHDSYFTNFIFFILI